MKRNLSGDGIAPLGPWKVRDVSQQQFAHRDGARTLFRVMDEAVAAVSERDIHAIGQ